MLLEALRHVGNRRFGAVIFRRTCPEITNEGGLWDESAKLYPLLGAQPNLSDLFWRFPSGAKVRFAHLQHEKNVHDWQGSQIPLVGFDELTHFTERQFFYLLSRNRSLCGVRPYIRATCNPDADSWVAEFLAWWIDEDTGLPIPERAGVPRWFARKGEKILWADAPAGLPRVEVNGEAVPPKSVTFVPASVQDNRILMEADPGYLANLLSLPLVERERLLGGNWKIRPAAGKVFNRAWFEIVDAAPAGGEECRFFDFATTKKTIQKADPDFTAGVLIRRNAGVYYVLDCLTLQEGPAEVEAVFKVTAKQDAARAKQQGVHYMVRWESEPGSASAREDLRFVQLLAGIDAAGVKSLTDKIGRARNFAAQCGARNVKLVRGHWNEEWLNHMHHQPEARHDDIMDASAGAFNALAAAPGGFKMGMPDRKQGGVLDRLPSGVFGDRRY